MKKEVKFTSAIDYILASISTVFIIGFFIALRFVFGLDLESIDMSDGDKVLLYIATVIFIFLYTLLIENVLRWTKLFITKFGKRLYNKKNIDGFPVNETFIGYKYIDNKVIIKECSEDVNLTNDMDFFEDTVWFSNMEFRQRAYNKLLRGMRKKLDKKLRKARRKRLDEVIELLEEKRVENREHIQVTVDLLEYINQYDKDKIVELDTYLYEMYDIKCKEYDAQSLLDDEYNGLDTFFDRIRNSRTYDILTTWILPISVGVSFLLFGFMYEWKFDNVLSDSDIILINILMFYLITKIPTTIIKAFVRFPTNYLKPTQDAAYIFKKYKNRKIKNEALIQEAKESTIVSETVETPED